MPRRKRPRRRRREADFQAFCAALLEVIDRQAPAIAEQVAATDVEAWVGERWPLPETVMLSTAQWARAFLAERQIVN